MTKFEASLRFFTMRSQLFPIDQFLYINKSVKFREKYIHIFVDIINTCYLHSLSLISIHKNLIVCVQKFYIFFLSTIMFSLHLYWSITALHCCVSFCCTRKWISYMYTYIPISPPSCVSLPPSLSHPSSWTQSTKLISLWDAAASH